MGAQKYTDIMELGEIGVCDGHKTFHTQAIHLVRIMDYVAKTI